MDNTSKTSKNNNKKWWKMNHMSLLILIIPWPKKLDFRIYRIEHAHLEIYTRPNNKKWCKSKVFENIIPSFFRIWIESQLIIFMHLKSLIHAYHFNHQMFINKQQLWMKQENLIKSTNFFKRTYSTPTIHEMWFHNPRINELFYWKFYFQILSKVSITYIH